jgi:pimeloyl-ACP methyl ester carboxylesterase
VAPDRCTGRVGPAAEEYSRSQAFHVGGGVSLIADVAGPPTGKTVVLLHGGGQTRHSWHHSLAVLASEGWRAIAVDLRGHGDSSRSPTGDYSMDAFAGDVREICRALGGPPPVLVGASLGGLASLLAVGEAVKAPAGALVLVDVAPRIERAGAQRVIGFMAAHRDGFPTLDAASQAIAGYTSHRGRAGSREGLARVVHRDASSDRWLWHWDRRFLDSLVDTDGLLGMAPARLDQAARRVSVPTLLIRGRESDVLSRIGVDQLLELIPHAEATEVATAGHMVAGDQNDAFTDSLMVFLRAHFPA